LHAHRGKPPGDPGRGRGRRHAGGGGAGPGHRGRLRGEGVAGPVPGHPQPPLACLARPVGPPALRRRAMLDPTSGYGLIHWVQGFSGPFLDAVFVNASRLGNETFYWIFLPLLYWLGDRRKVFPVVLVLFISFFLNDFAKNLFDLPRRSTEQVRVLFAESGTGPGFPSGHAQNAVVLWGALAMEVRRWWMTLLAVVLTVVISVSRIYLGLHFPLDVIGGLVLGAVILMGYSVFRRISRSMQPSPLRDAL